MPTHPTPAGGTYRPDQRAEIRRLAADDSGLIPQTEAILARGLGDGYVPRSELAAKLSSTAGPDGVFGAFVSGRLVGVATTGEVTPAMVADISKQVGRFNSSSLGLDVQPIGLVQSSTVERRWRRRGLGGGLLSARLHHLQAAGCTVALALSWVSEDEDSSLGILENSGFARLAELGEYWLADSQRQGYSCPRCGHPCRCTAVILRRELP